MQPHEQRVVDERTELDKKLEALWAFMHDNPIFKTLDEIDQSLLKEQEALMVSYSIILEQRINRFT